MMMTSVVFGSIVALYETVRVDQHPTVPTVMAEADDPYGQPDRNISFFFFDDFPCIR